MKGYKNYIEMAVMLGIKKDSQYEKKLNRIRSIAQSHKFIKSEELPKKNYFLDVDAEQIIYVYNNKFSDEIEADEEISEEEKFNGKYIIYNEYMKLEQSEFDILVKKYGEEMVDTKIEQQQLYVKENPHKKYRNNYIALNNWLAKEKTQREYAERLECNYQEKVEKETKEAYEITDSNFPQEVNVIVQNINGKDVLIFKDEYNGVTYIATEWLKI